jgi:hypothetical protein
MSIILWKFGEVVVLLVVIRVAAALIAKVIESWRNLR